ncbi:MAG TPA: ribokinase [Steroidobacteraceae bacterium]|jgi:ribokinase|nr:ribokinase [Steroidobacteraceae bacterium]
MKSRRIVIVGSSGTDMIIKLDRIPRPGETLLGGEFHVTGGGKGANQAVSAARAGGNVAFVARVGQDEFGEQAIAAFVKERINVDHVYRDRKVSTGVALIFVDQQGENSIGVAPGANARLSPADVKKCRKIFTGASVMVVQLEIPLDTVQTAALLAAQSGARVILNPAPARPLPDELLRHVSILTPNETEAELLTGIRVDNDSTAAKAAAVLRARGVQTVILTLGARGALLASDESTQIVAGFKVKPIDTTGAGDVFNGALAVALAEEKALKDAVRFANAAAAISVTRLGAQPSAPVRRAIEKLLKSA